MLKDHFGLFTARLLFTLQAYRHFLTTKYLFITLNSPAARLDNAAPTFAASATALLVWSAAEPWASSLHS